jgi:hypothetical protein
VGISAATDARLALLGGLIDHAPTFPPASLPPGEALVEDRRALASDVRFMLGRLVWPASLWDRLGDEQRAVSVVLDGPLPDDGRVESVELRFSADVDRLEGEVYVELPAAALEELRGLRERGLRAKVRCGGAEVPTIEELAGFIRTCRAAGIVFKATAGLHHAVRTGAEHGFLNLLAAVVFGDEEEALAETDVDAFGLTAESFSWRDRAAGPDALASARRERFHAIGSCSFFEPVDELRDLDLLPA